jgi:transcriptional regulator with XRE-family HTH domain
MKQKLKKQIGVKMRKFRKKLGLTQTEMVSHFDIGRANYSRIEKGEVFPNVLILYTLKTKFNLSLDWLIDAESVNGDEAEMMLQGEKKWKKNPGFGEDSEEIEELFFTMGKIPMIKHAVLSHFLEYKLKNNDLIQKLFREIERAKPRKKAKR